MITCSLPIALFAPWKAAAQSSPCDPGLQTVTTSPYGYRLRGDRCEGIYVKMVSGSTLKVVSFTASFEDYDLSDSKDIQIEWSASDGSDVRLRAQGIAPRLYYRMDTVRLPGSSSFSWPSQLLAALNISKKKLGLVGWTFYRFGDIERDVFLPLRVSQQREPGPTGSYDLVLQPGRELKEVYISLATVDADGEPVSFLRDGEPLGYGYYPAGRGFHIRITDQLPAGIYYLEISALLSSGAATSTELLFYHSAF
jgi:hypothetical protein